MKPPSRKGQESTALSKRCEEVRQVICKMDEDQIWDSIQARDLDPRIIDFVSDQFEKGLTAGEVAKSLNILGGKNSRQFKKIQAYFRQGFRADAEAYLYQQTHKLYKTIEKARDVLEDAFEEGVPIVVTHQGTKDSQGYTEVIKVKGATKELASFLKSYSDAIALPVKLWKDFGAIGEKKDVGPGGLTILVQNQIPMPSVEEIRAHQEQMKAKASAIEVNYERVDEKNI